MRESIADRRGHLAAPGGRLARFRAGICPACPGDAEPDARRREQHGRREPPQPPHVPLLGAAAEPRRRLSRPQISNVPTTDKVRLALSSPSRCRPSWARLLPQCPSPRRAPAACAARRRCAGSSARPRSRPTTSSIRSSSARAKGVQREISSLPGQFHFSVDALAREAEEIAKLGIPVGDPVRPAREEGRGRQRGLASRGRRADARSAPSRRPTPELMVAVDACFCEYTTHGHCGVVGERRGRQRRHARKPGARWRCPTRAPAPTSSRRRA